MLRTIVNNVKSWNERRTSVLGLLLGRASWRRKRWKRRLTGCKGARRRGSLTQAERKVRKGTLLRGCPLNAQETAGNLEVDEDDAHAACKPRADSSFRKLVDYLFRL